MKAETRMQNENGWKKHLWGSALLVVAWLMVQSLAAVWWASQITTRVEHVEHQVIRVTDRVHNLELDR